MYIYIYLIFNHFRSYVCCVFQFKTKLNTCLLCLPTSGLGDVEVERVPAGRVSSPCWPGTHLVGGFNLSEKYESVGINIPNIWKNKTCSKPPTSHGLEVPTICEAEFLSLFYRPSFGGLCKGISVQHMAEKYGLTSKFRVLKWPLTSRFYHALSDAS